MWCYRFLMCEYTIAILPFRYGCFPNTGSPNYWPFVALNAPILQGPRSSRGAIVRNDMAFRPALTALRAAWESVIGGPSRPADGFFLIHELRVSRRRIRYPSELLRAYRAALTQVAKT